MISRKQFIKRLLNKHKYYLFVVIFIETISYTSSFLLSGLFKRDLFNILEHKEVILGITNISVLILLNTCIPLIINCVKQINSGLVSQINMRLKNTARIQLFNDFIECPEKDDIGIGELMGKYINDCSDITDYILEYYYQLPKIILSFAVILVLLKINFLFTLISIIPSLLVILLIKSFEKRIINLRAKSRKASTSLIEFMENLFGNIEYFRLSTNTKEIKYIYKNKCKKRAKSMLHDKVLESILTICSGKSMSIILGIILILAIPFFKNGSFTVGDFVLFEYYFWFLAYLPESIGNLLRKYKQSNFSYERLNLIKGQIEEFKFINTLDIHEDKLQIVYNDEIIKLNMGESLLIKGVNSKELLKEIFRIGTKQSNRLCFVPSIPKLFSGTIKDNICWGNKIDNLLFQKVINMADLNKDLEIIQEGKDKLVGKNGTAVSGGQKKRIALARALYSQPNILLIEDFSAALDKETQKVIAKSIIEDNKTIKIISCVNDDIENYVDIIWDFDKDIIKRKSINLV